MKVSNARPRGFTLIEILIVVVILGILAAIVIPQFSSASQEASISSVRSQLQTLRSQVELFRVQQGEYPSNGIIGTLPPASDGESSGGPAGPGGFSELVDKGYLQRLPEVPANWTLTLTAGDVTASYADDPEDPSDNLPNGINPANW